MPESRIHCATAFASPSGIFRTKTLTCQTKTATQRDNERNVCEKSLQLCQIVSKDESSKTIRRVGQQPILGWQTQGLIEREQIGWVVQGHVP